jgi:hypothetical protein
MQLTDEERFAVSMLFSGDAEFDHSVRDQLAVARVSEGKYTGVGIFSDLSSPFPVPERHRRARDWVSTIRSRSTADPSCARSPTLG